MEFICLSGCNHSRLWNLDKNMSLLILPTQKMSRKGRHYFFMRKIFKFLYLTRRDRGRESTSILLDYSPNDCHGQDCSQETGIQFRSPTWLAWTQVCDPSHAISQGVRYRKLQSGVDSRFGCRPSDVGCGCFHLLLRLDSSLDRYFLKLCLSPGGLQVNMQDDIL